MQGRWYITAGLNPLFDDFDCQEHYFGVPEAGKLYGKINWRIKKPNDEFIERSTVQTFKQVGLNMHTPHRVLPCCSPSSRHKLLYMTMQILVELHK